MKVFIIILLGFYGLYLIYRSIANFYWSSGKVPPFLPFNESNEFIVYTALGASLIGADRNDTRAKTHYLHYYLSKHFPEDLHHFSSTLVDCYKRPIQIVSIAKWIRKHTKEEQARINTLDFAVKFSMIDGYIIQREYKRLQLLAQHLEIKDEDYDRIIRFYIEEEQQKQAASSSPSSSLKSRYLKLLGLTEEANFIEVKKAYRYLAKKYHPDRMIKASKFQKQEAREQFIRIQTAYDFLEREMK